MKKHEPEIVEELGKLNEIIHIEYKRPDGSTAVEWDYKNCPSMAEQHTAHLTDINWLVARYKPDELAAYMAARTQYRQEILGHDFSKEPNLQEAKNTLYSMKKAFEDLDPDIKMHFKNHVEFLKFIDNPANAEKMIKLGILKPKQIESLTTPTPPIEQKAKNNDDSNDDKTTKNR